MPAEAAPAQEQQTQQPATQAAPPAPANNSAPANWVEGIQNEEIRGWAMNKGFHQKSPADALESYRNLEKTFGADRAGRTVVLPSNWEDQTEVGQFYEKLGRPKTSNDYGFKVEGGDEGFVKWAKDTFFEAGLPARQADLIVNKYQEFQKAQIEGYNQIQQTKFDGDVKALKAEWGAAFEANAKIVDSAAVKLGVTAQQLEGLKTVMGPAAAMKFLHNIGSRVGEDTFVEGGNKQGFGPLTPAQAKDKLNAMAADGEFMKALTMQNHPKHEWAVAEKSKLVQMMVAGGNV